VYTKFGEGRKHIVALVDLHPRMNELRLEVGEDLQPVPLLDGEHTTRLGTSLDVVDAKTTHQTLKKNANIFLWRTSDMSGVSQ